VSIEGAAITADFTTEPFLHQYREFEAHCETPSRALLWQMRTGKTKLTVDTACHLYSRGLIDAVLLFAPNGVHENWTRRELPKHHWGTVPRDTLAWSTDVAGERGVDRVPARERRGWQEQHDGWWERAERLLGHADRLCWFAFASSSMTRKDVRGLVARVVRRKRLLVVFDEAHDFRTPGSKRAHMARALAKRCAYRRILTGTPLTNSPLHAWAQFELLEPACLGFGKYSDFKRHHASYRMETNRSGQSYPVLDGYRNLDELRDKLAPWSSVVLRSDCHDLPDVVRRSRHVEPTDEQLRLYRELHRSFEVELDDGTAVSVGEATSRMTKMQQVMSGFIYDEWKDLHWLGANPRLDAMSDEVYLCPGKIIVWCRFRPDMDAVAARLTADGHEIVQYHGRVSDEDKNAAIDRFQNDGDVKALVGYPFLGLDVSAAMEVMWYSHTFDAILRGQADERATVMGGGNVQLTEIVMPGVDPYILENVAAKRDVADAVAGSGLRDLLERTRI
jgi:hypothetical protein